MYNFMISADTKSVKGAEKFPDAYANAPFIGFRVSGSIKAGAVNRK